MTTPDNRMQIGIRKHFGFRIVTTGDRLMRVEFPPILDTTFSRQQLESLQEDLASLTIDFDKFPLFTRQVYKIMLSIPMGETMTYSELAAKAGRPKAHRAAAGACARNKMPIAIPCHRVVGRNGLGGYSAGLEWKKQLLDLESQKVEFPDDPAPFTAI